MDNKETYTYDLFDQSYNGLSEKLEKERKKQQELEEEAEQKKREAFETYKKKKEQDFWKKHKDGWIDFK